MKRRDFLKGLGVFTLATTVATKFGGLFNKAAAAIVHVAAGKLGYKEVAGDAQVKAGKKCDTCAWYKGDPAEAGAGQCTLKAMQTAMKAPVIYVKNGGYCNMWKKKA